MGLIEDAKSLTITEFGGTRSNYDAVDLPIGDALVALNCRFAPGRVRTRTGFELYSSLATNHRQGSPYYWSQAQEGESIDYMARVTSDNINDYVVVSNVTTGVDLATIFTIPCDNPSVTPIAFFAAFGARLYFTLIQINTTLSELNPGLPYVWDGDLTHTAKPAFQRPMLNTTELALTLAEPAAGTVTAGDHNVGVLFQTLGGYWTKPGPADTSINLVATSITSAGNKIIRATLNPNGNFPDWIQAAQLIMTPADNPYEYFVIPGTITAITAGSAVNVTIDIDIADEQLTAIGSEGAGTLADDYFRLLSMDASNAPPFSCKFVMAWGERVTWFAHYGGQDCFFPSDPLNPEWITASQHLKILPGAKPFGSAFPLHSLLYVVSNAGGLYAYIDNNGRPVYFSPPETIDDRVSTAGPGCSVTNSSGGYSLIAAIQGLFFYTGGAFPQLPISYDQQPDWDNIYWGDAVGNLEAQVIDWGQENLCIVLVQSRTAPVGHNWRMRVWSYDSGVGRGKTKFCYWTNTMFRSGRSAEIIRYLGSWVLVVCCNFGAITRMILPKFGETSATLYTDYSLVPAGIDWQYQTALLPNNPPDLMLNNIASLVRAKSLRSTAAMTVAVKSLDDARTTTVPASPITLSTAPGKPTAVVYDGVEEQVAYLFTNSAVIGTGIELAKLTHFYDFMAEAREI